MNEFKIKITVITKDDNDELDTFTAVSPTLIGTTSSALELVSRLQKLVENEAGIEIA